MIGQAIKRQSCSFTAFFICWAKEVKGWAVPKLHIEVCRWLEDTSRVNILKIFRGAAKSTIVALYVAWILRENPELLVLIQAADDDTAAKMSADIRAIIERHPWCRGMKNKSRWQITKFDVTGNTDKRNASVTACGIMSNVTSSRADLVIFDDIEVPKNCLTEQTRAMLRMRESDATHILKPGGKKLYIGTPHTHDSIYDEKEAEGARVFCRPLFSIPDDRPDLKAAYDNLMVNKEYAPLLDECNQWPEYFTAEEVVFRRKECKTQNEWDSQYMLQARPVHDIRLNPASMIVYDSEAHIIAANGSVSMFIDNIQMIGASTYWDISLGKAHSDDSVLSVIFTDEAGQLYWHIAESLTGNVDEQCKQVRAIVEQYNLPVVTVETNGAGGFVPHILRKHLNGLTCGVNEYHAKEQKVKRILDAFDAPLSGGFLHVQRNVYAGKMPRQMRDWIPINTNQPDDFLDSGAGAILNTPVRIGKMVNNMPQAEFATWIPDSGTYEVAVDC